MDPVSIAAGVAAILAPYIKEGGEALIRTAGEVGLEKAKLLWGYLKQRWTGDPEATRTLERFEKNPEGYQDPLKDLLQEKMARDPELTTALNEQVKEVASQLKLTIDVDEAGNITGIKADEIRRAMVDVTIRAGKVQGHVIGVDAKSV